MGAFWVQVGLKAIRFIVSAAVFFGAIMLGKTLKEKKAKKEESNI